MKNTTYSRFVKRWEEVTDLPPQQVGVFTPYYRAIVKRLKVMPWPMLVFTAVVVVVVLYLVLGSTITFLVSMLQKGF